MCLRCSDSNGTSSTDTYSSDASDAGEGDEDSGVPDYEGNYTKLKFEHINCTFAFYIIIFDWIVL